MKKGIAVLLLIVLALSAVFAQGKAEQDPVDSVSAYSGKDHQKKENHSYQEEKNRTTYSSILRSRVFNS